MSRSSWRLPGLIGLLVLVLLRAAWAGAVPLNSDEPQHAHVAWSWTHGLLLYRDVFDNHGPLFGWFYAPLLRLLDGRPDVLWWLRQAMLPWYLLALVATWLGGRRLYAAGPTAAAVLLAGSMQEFCVKTVEFRTDGMWAALWLLAGALALGARGRAARWFLAGLAAGAAFAVSQKTLPLLSTALVAAVFARPWRAQGAHRWTPGPALAWSAAGLLVVPGAFALWLAWRHDLGPAWVDLFGTGLAQGGGKVRLWRVLVYLGLASWLLYLAHRRLRKPGAGDLRSRLRLLVALQVALYACLIWIAWPLSTPQDFLPVIPPAMLLAVGTVAERRWLAPVRRQRALLVAAWLLELALLVHHAPPWRDALAPWRATLTDVLRYSDPADTVMDAKSGAIFRARPYYPVLETMTLRSLKSGRMPDLIVPAMESRRTMAVIPERLPPRDLAFVRGNYLPGNSALWIAGQVLGPANGAEPITFRLALGGRYVLVHDGAPVAARIDGRPPAPRWSLAAGTHTLSGEPAGKSSLVWSKAWDRGWRPLHR